MVREQTRSCSPFGSWGPRRARRGRGPATGPGSRGVHAKIQRAQRRPRPVHRGGPGPGGPAAAGRRAAPRPSPSPPTTCRPGRPTASCGRWRRRAARSSPAAPSPRCVRPRRGRGHRAERSELRRARTRRPATRPSCNLSFTIGSGSATVRALAVSPDKKTLYAGGYFGAVNGTPVSSLAAIDIATCTPKATFHPSVSATVRALAVTDDTVYVGGDFTAVGGSARARLRGGRRHRRRCKPFPADVDEPGRAVAVTPDGNNVILGGDFFTVNGAELARPGRRRLRRPAPSSRPTRRFIDDQLGGQGRSTRTPPASTPATRAPAAASSTAASRFDLTDFNQRWRDTCLGATQAVQSYQDVLYSASHAHDCSSVGRVPRRAAPPPARRADRPAPTSWAGSRTPTTVSARASARASWRSRTGRTPSTCGSAASSPPSTARRASRA